MYDQSSPVSSSSSITAQDALCDAVAELALGPGKDGEQPAPLRGLPVPQGSRVVFDDEGDAVDEASGRVLLRGVPPPSGKHVRFDQQASSV